MDDLLTLILTPLAAEPARQIVRRFAQIRLDLDLDEVYALKEALQDAPEVFPPGWWLDAHLSRWWLCLHVDWKASDEVAWQVQAIARTLGLNDFSVSAQMNRPDGQTLDVLAEASAWLHPRGYNLLYLDTESDEYLAVPIRLDLLQLARDTTSRLNLPTFSV